MKKLFMMVAVFALALSANAQSAITSTTGQGTGGALKIANELGQSTIPATKFIITYTPAIALGATNNLTFTFTNGAVQATGGNVYYLLDGSGATVAHLVDFTADGNGNYTMMKFQLDTDVPGNAPLNFSEADGSQADPTIVPAGVMTVQVTQALDSTGQPLNAPLTAPFTMVEFADQFSVVLGSAAANHVDVTNGRLTFVGGSTTTDNFTVTLKNNFTHFDVFVTIDPAHDSAVLELAGDFTGVSSVNSSYSAPDVTVSQDPSTGHYLVTYTGTGNVATIADNLTITVDGATALDARTITAKATIHHDTYAREAATGDAFIWTMEGGTVFKVPYATLYDNAYNDDHDPSVDRNQNYTCFIRITNESDASAEIMFDVADEAGTSQVTNVSSGIFVPAHGSVTLFGNDLWDAAIAAGWAPTLGSINWTRCSLTFLVLAPENKVHAVAFMYTPGGYQRLMPVLFNDTDGRTWWQ